MKKGILLFCPGHHTGLLLFFYYYFLVIYKTTQSLKTKVFNQCVLPVMRYGAETWILTARLVPKFKVAQRAIKRTMLGVSLRDRIQNEVIRERTKVTDIADRITSLKWLAISAVEPITDGVNEFWSGDRVSVNEV
jgi:hypothetical protein